MRRSVARSTAAALLLSTLAATSLANDDAASAAELAQRGEAAYQAGDFRRAAQLFDTAFAAEPNAGVKYNAALAWDQAGERARAADGFDTAIELGSLDPDRQRASELRLAALERLVARLSLSCPRGARVSVPETHVRTAAIPVSFHLEPGRHELVIERAGSVLHRRSVTARAGEALEVEAPCERVRPALVPASPRPSPPAAPIDDERSDSVGPGAWPWVAFALAGAFSGAAVVFGLQALEANREFDDSGDLNAEARQRAVTFRALTNVAIGAAVVSAGLGLYLVVDSPSPGSASVQVRVHF